MTLLSPCNPNASWEWWSYTLPRDERSQSDAHDPDGEDAVLDIVDRMLSNRNAEGTNRHQPWYLREVAD